MRHKVKKNFDWSNQHACATIYIFRIFRSKFYKFPDACQLNLEHSQIGCSIKHITATHFMQPLPFIASHIHLCVQVWGVLLLKTFYGR